MLFLSTSGKLQRIHGSFVSEEDVIAVVDFWKKQGQPKYIELQEDQASNNNMYDSSDEPYYKQAVELIRSTQKVSTSFLQRNFPIGYNRAAKIIEQMEKEGIISRGDKFGRNREIF
jgi:S-DNA-T family DNA segregation ATPase FtsK/SpoIIIE